MYEISFHVSITKKYRNPTAFEIVNNHFPTISLETSGAGELWGSSRGASEHEGGGWVPPHCSLVASS